MKAKKPSNNTIQEFISLGASVYQAKRKAKLVDNYKEGDVLSDGQNYTIYVSVGIHPIEALKQETLDWAYWDTLHPPTPTDIAMTAHAEGRSKKCYNEISLISPEMFQ